MNFLKDRIEFFVFIFLVVFFFPSVALANSASINTNNSTPIADGKTVSVVTVVLNDDSGHSIYGRYVYLNNTNSDPGLSIIANNSGTCGSIKNISSQALTDTNGSALFGVCSSRVGTDTFRVSDDTGNLGTININFVSGCTDSKPGTPQLQSAVGNGTDKITLTWTGVSAPVSNYLLGYGQASAQYIYGSPNIGGQGATTYTVGSLASGTKYYFAIKAQNGCMPGDYSNELWATTTSSGTVSTNSATPTPTTQSSIPTSSPTPARSVITVTTPTGKATITSKPTVAPLPTNTPIPFPTQAKTIVESTNTISQTQIIIGSIILISLIGLSTGYLITRKREIS